MVEMCDDCLQMIVFFFLGLATATVEFRSERFVALATVYVHYHDKWEDC